MKYKPDIYIKNTNNSCRFALGNSGKKTIRIMGLNPNTADDKKPDRTIRSVINLVKNSEYDGYVMLNLYPQRATNPSDLDPEINLNVHKKNIETISNIMNEHKIKSILACWGNEINTRSYLMICFKEIYESIKTINIQWLMIKLNESGHPRHPLYISKIAEFRKFNINNYNNLRPLKNRFTGTCKKP